VGERSGEDQKLDTINTVLRAWLYGLSRFHEMGVITYEIFLPMVTKNG
jgi:hypothetical protein